jgi:nitrogen fixation/metabolism regulation signal transduction histidine kinase
MGGRELLSQLLFRASHSYVRDCKASGTGIGLSISKKVADVHQIKNLLQTQALSNILMVLVSGLDCPMLEFNA